jgi:hypothetical protein
MSVGVGAEPNFLRRIVRRLLLLGPLLPILFVLVTAVVHQFAYWGTSLWRDFDEIHSDLFGHLESLEGLDDADLSALVVDQSNGTDPDLSIDPRAPVLGHLR